MATNATSKPSTPATGTVTTFPKVPFTVTVIVKDLNIRKTPTSKDSSNLTGKVAGKGTFTITEVKDGWGKLKSGAGWIYLANKSYCTIGKSAASSVSSSTTSNVPYTVKVTGTGSKKGWGKLKSGRGWISLDYTTKK